jgi:protein-disulfide isomerase
MASRAQQKAQARERRLAEERARTERAQRQRRLQMLGGVVVVAIAVIAVAIAISVSGGKSHTGLANTPKGAQAVEASVNRLLNGVPEHGAVLGNPSAPVTITYYGDYECPYCREFTLYGGLSPLIASQVRSGRVKVVYSPFETATRSPSVFRLQQVAGLAAGMQGKFWYYTELFYHEQGQEDTGYVTESYLDGLAKQVPGLNYSQWLAARQKGSLVSQINGDENAGIKAGITGTPTLVVRGPRGQTEPQASTTNAAIYTYSSLLQAIKQVS